MVIHIGGVSCAGKTLMAQRLLEKYKYPYLSIDHLKMGLYRAGGDCGFTPESGTGLIAERLWPILSGMIMTNIENRQNLIIEGCYLLPQRVAELGAEYLESVLLFYIGFSERYIRENFEAKIISNRCAIEARGYENDFGIDDYIAENREQGLLCEKYGASYFEIDRDYESEMSAVYAWIDREMGRAGDRDGKMGHI